MNAISLYRRSHIRSFTQKKSWAMCTKYSNSLCESETGRRRGSSTSDTNYTPMWWSESISK